MGSSGTKKSRKGTHPQHLAKVGTPAGTVQVAVTGNTGGPRSGTLRVATETVAVQQAGVCTYSIKPNDYHAGRGPA